MTVRATVPPRPEAPPEHRAPSHADAGAAALWRSTPRLWRDRIRRGAPAVLVLGSLGVVGVVAASVSVTAGGPGSETSAPAAAMTQAAVSGTAVDALAGIPVAARGPSVTSPSKRFYAGWGDPDGNGCTTREDVLLRDLRDVVLKRGKACAIKTGTLVDPYGGAAVAFGPDAESKKQVEVDHVVSLSDAWRSGASAWTPQQRLAFANDPLELVATTKALNQPDTGKGSKDAAQWLPPNTAYRCAYVARQVAVKSAYHLTMTQAEKDAVAGVLATCPGQTLPRAAAPA